VYLASLDALRHGERLGSEVFASQPPVFYLVLGVIGLFAGHSLEAARIGFLLVALVGCAGAYALGRALGGIAAGLAAAGMVLILPPFASEAMRVDADVPAVSFTLVALALVAWATHREAPHWLAALGGAALVVAILVKLDAVVAIVPFAALLLFGHRPRRGWLRPRPPEAWWWRQLS
jgi:4-amino-4-deoxy-L-arabinose transferase-like glycosyltransferase